MSDFTPPQQDYEEFLADIQYEFNKRVSDRIMELSPQLKDTASVLAAMKDNLVEMAALQYMTYIASSMIRVENESE